MNRFQKRSSFSAIETFFKAGSLKMRLKDNCVGISLQIVFQFSVFSNCLFSKNLFDQVWLKLVTR